MITSKLAYIICVSVLILPKINIISFGDATFIRMDDVLIMFYFVFRFKFILRLYLVLVKSKFWMQLFSLFVVASLISSIMAGTSNRVGLASSIMFSIRHVEYLIYFFLGVDAFVFGFRHRNVFLIVVIIYCAVVPLQLFGLLGAASNFSSERAIANTSGPYELAAVISFLLLYFVHSYGVGFWRFITIFCFCILLATGSRITIAAVTFVIALQFSAEIKRLSTRHFGSLIVILLCLMPILYFFSPAADGVLVRYESIINMDIDSLSDWVSKVPIIASQADYNYYAYDQLLNSTVLPDGDASALIRFYRWAILIQYVISDPLLIIFGAGPSFAYVAVDGFYVRLFIETGLMGFLFYLLFVCSIYRAYRGNFLVKGFVLVMFFTGLFIDIFVSSKAMFLFWFWIGYCFLPRAGNMKE